MRELQDRDKSCHNPVLKDLIVSLLCEGLKCLTLADGMKKKQRQIRQHSTYQKTSPELFSSLLEIFHSNGNMI